MSPVCMMAQVMRAPAVELPSALLMANIAS
jgi:hypothetical protein